jgi:hypothetical protein
MNQGETGGGSSPGTPLSFAGKPAIPNRAGIVTGSFAIRT